MKIVAITINTTKEILRDRTFYAIIIFGLLIILSSKLIAPLSLDEDLRIVRDIGTSAISIFGILIAIIIGTRLVYDEIKRKTIYTILPKPVQRWQFILGKYLGISLALLIVVLVLTAGFVVYSLIFKYPLTLNLPKTIYFILLELLLIAAIAILLSTFTTPIGSGIFTFAIYFIGHFTQDLLAFAQIAKSLILKDLSTLFYYILPNLSYLNSKTEFVHNLPITNQWLIFVSAYTIAYIIILLSIAVIIFEKKDL